MAAARDRTRSIAAVVRAHRHAAPIGLACGALIAGVMLLGNPFSANPAPRAAHSEIRLGAAELSLPEPAPAPAVPAAPKPPPAPTRQASAPVSIVPPTAAPATRQMGGGKRATIIVETLPMKPIIPPFAPKPAAGTAPEPRPTLPLDTEIGKTTTTAPAAAPRPKTAAASLSRDG
jgi:translation initiation factor IF-2